jgi:hypothetical protein
MNRVMIGRGMIAASLALGAIGSTIIDNAGGSTAHMLAIATWPPHALFHDAAMFLLLDSVSLICLWLLFRKSREPIVAARVATLVVLAYWLPFFFITTLFPQASLMPESPVGMPYNMGNVGQWSPNVRQATPFILGMPLYLNAAVAAWWISIALIGYRVFSKAMRAGEVDPLWLP